MAFNPHLELLLGRWNAVTHYSFAYPAEKITPFVQEYFGKKPQKPSGLFSVDTELLRLDRITDDGFVIRSQAMSGNKGFVHANVRLVLDENRAMVTYRLSSLDRFALGIACLATLLTSLAAWLTPAFGHSNWVMRFLFLFVFLTLFTFKRTYVNAACDNVDNFLRQKLKWKEAEV